MPSKRIFLLTAGFLVLLVGTTWFVLERSGAARAFAQRYLAKVIQGEFDLEDASVDLAAGSLSLHGLALPRGSGTAAMTRVDSISIDIDAGLSPRQITVRGWELDIDLGDPEARNVWDLLRLDDGPDPEAGLPTVRVHDSRVIVHLDPDLPPLRLEDLELELLPEHDAADAHVLRGTATLNGVVRLELSGHGVPADDSLRILVTGAAVELDRDLVAAFAPEISTLWPDLELRGSLENGSLWLEYDGKAASETLAAGAEFEVQDLAAAWTGFPYPLDGVRARVALDTRESGSLRMQIDREESDLPFTAVGRATKLQTDRPTAELEVRAPTIEIDERLERALAELPVLQRVWNALEPTAGSFGLDLLATWPEGFETDPAIVARADVRGAAGRYMGYRTSEGEPTPGFPVPVRDVSGTVIVEGEIVRLEDFTGEVAPAAGRGRVRASGFVDVREDGPIDLRFQSDSVEFHRGVRQAVGELLANEADPAFGTRLWDSFAPVGRAALDVHVELDHFRVDLRPLEASVTWDRFPLPIDDLAGLIRIDEAGVALDLTGRQADARLALDARIRSEPGDEFETELMLDATGVAFSPDLQRAVAAFSPVLGGVWDQVRPGGRTDLQVVFWRTTANGPAHYDARLDLAGANLDYVDLPIPVHDMTGSIHVQGRDQQSRLILEQVRGAVSPGDGEPAPILAQGVVELLDGAVESEEISAVIQGLPLTQALARGLAAGDVLPFEVWETMRPAGTVDCTYHRWQQGRGNAPHQELDLTLVDVSSAAAMLPGPATAIRGTLEVRDGSVAFRDLSARMRETEIQCLEGSVVTDDERTHVTATVRSGGEFPIDDAWANLLSGPAQQALLDRRIRGHARINELRVAFHIPRDGSAFRTEITGQLAIGDTGLELGARAEGLVGLVQIDRAVFDDDLGIVEGSLRDVDFSLLGHPVEEFSGRFRADVDGVIFDDASFSLYDGRVRGVPDGGPPLTYSYEGEGLLRADLTIENLTLSRLLRGAGHSGTPYRGIVSGRITLDRLAGDDLLGLRGSGSLEIADADLGVVPMFAAIYQYFVPDQRPRFDAASMRFSIGERALTIEELAVDSSFLGVTGSGKLGLDGYVDMVMRVEDLLGNDNSWLVVPLAINLFTRGVVRFHVYGHLRTLKARPRFLMQSDPDYQPLSPLPPRARTRSHPGF